MLTSAPTLSSVSAGITARLMAIETDPSAVRAVWHPLGFMDLELWSDGGRSLRLHIWSPLPGRYCSAPLRIHKHDWDLTSSVVCGALRNDLIQVADGESTHQIYEIEYSGDVNRLVATGRLVSASLNRSDDIRSGAVYRVPAGVFHDVAVLSSVTATLVEAVRKPPARNELLGDVDGPASYVTRRVPCDVGSVRTAVRYVLGCIA